MFGLSEDEVAGANVAAFLNAKEVRAPYAIDMGFQETKIACGERFSYNGVGFWYVEPWKLLCTVEGFSFEADFEQRETLFTPHFFGSGENAVYYVVNGKMFRGTL